MTASAFATSSHTTTSAHRPGFDLLVERVAKSLLAWSDRRATRHELTHERMALILENQRATNRERSSLRR